MSADKGENNVNSADIIALRSMKIMIPLLVSKVNPFPHLAGSVLTLGTVPIEDAPDEWSLPLSLNQRPNRVNCPKLTSLLHRFWGMIPHAMRELTRKQALAVQCPTCGAKPGERCQFATGQPRTEPHRDRRVIAKENEA